MADYRMCTACSQKFYVGKQKPAPALCGICDPRMPEIRWDLVPVLRRHIASEESEPEVVEA